MKFFLLILFGFFISFETILSKDIQKKIVLGNFKPHKSDPDTNTQDKLQSSLVNTFESKEE
jgi:hypothetical protein